MVSLLNYKAVTEDLHQRQDASARKVSEPEDGNNKLSIKELESGLAKQRDDKRRVLSKRPKIYATRSPKNVDAVKTEMPENGHQRLYSSRPQQQQKQHETKMNEHSQSTSEPASYALSQSFAGLQFHTNQPQMSSENNNKSDELALSRFPSQPDRCPVESDYMSSNNNNFTVTWRNLKFCIEPKWHTRLGNTSSQRLSKFARLMTSRTKTNEEFQVVRDTKQVESLERAETVVIASTGSSERDNAPRIVLDHLDGSFNSGELTAILGPSGAGKTTLLDCLTGHRKSGLSGSIRINPRSDSRTKIGSSNCVCCLCKRTTVAATKCNAAAITTSNNGDNLKVSIIPQNDHLIGHLTVFETLNYASKMKNCHQQEFDHKLNIQRIAQQLGLMTCLETRINKLSGGQYKRVSIAQELLSSPDILILDEPTSGLDAMTCYQTVQVLRELTDERQRSCEAGGTQKPIAVILTIHQPNRDVFQQFNHVYVVAQGGKCIYEGTPNNIESIINRINLHLPNSYYNPATMIVEIAAGKFGHESIMKLNSIQKKNYAQQFASSPGDETANSTGDSAVDCPSSSCSFASSSSTHTNSDDDEGQVDKSGLSKQEAHTPKEDSSKKVIEESSSNSSEEELATNDKVHQDGTAQKFANQDRKQSSRHNNEENRPELEQCRLHGRRSNGISMIESMKSAKTDLLMIVKKENNNNNNNNNNEYEIISGTQKGTKEDANNNSNNSNQCSVAAEKIDNSYGGLINEGFMMDDDQPRRRSTQLPQQQIITNGEHRNDIPMADRMAKDREDKRSQQLHDDSNDDDEPIVMLGTGAMSQKKQFVGSASAESYCTCYHNNNYRLANDEEEEEEDDDDEEEEEEDDKINTPTTRLEPREQKASSNLRSSSADLSTFVVVSSPSDYCCFQAAGETNNNNIENRGRKKRRRARRRAALCTVAPAAKHSPASEACPKLSEICSSGGGGGGGGGGANSRRSEKRLKLNSLKADQKFPFWRHTYLHFHRSWLSIVRDPMLCSMQLALHIIVPVMVSLVYGTQVGKPNACPRAGPVNIMAFALEPNDTALQLQEDLRTTLENIGYIFFKLYGIIFAAMTVTVLTFPLDMHVLVKEFRNGWYGLSSYFLGRTLADIPFQLTLPLLAMSLSYYATGQPYSQFQWRFFSITAILILSSLIAQSQGLLFGAILMDRMKAAVFVAPAATTPIILFAGFLVRTQSIPHYLRPLSNLSYLRYAIEACLISRYGFNQCECDPAIFNQTVPELPPIARSMLDYWLSSFKPNSALEANANATAIIETTTISDLEQPDLFTKLIDSLTRANSFGRNITSCEQVVPYPMMDYDLKDSQLIQCFAILLAMLIITRMLTFFIVCFKVKRKV